MLSDKTPICFVASADTKRARRFYEEVLGLKCLSDDGFGLVFELGMTVLRVQAVPDFEPQGQSVHGWRVDDIASEIKELSANGVEFMRFPCFEQNDLGVWETPGAKVAWFADPDGNILSLTEVR